MATKRPVRRRRPPAIPVPAFPVRRPAAKKVAATFSPAAGGKEPYATLHRQVFEATRDGNVEQVKSAHFPDVVWHGGAPEPLRGREAVLDRVRAMFGAADNRVRCNPTTVMASDDHTAALAWATIRAGGQVVLSGRGTGPRRRRDGHPALKVCAALGT